MAISDALAWRINNGGTADDLYNDIRTFLASSPDAATTQSAMAQYGISPEDVANATGGKSGGLLGGNILAGASWNSLNTALPEQLTAATGQATTNVAVGGATTADTLNQLNTFLANGGAFDPNATVFLQTGGVDFLQGVDKATIKDNINQIVKTLGAQGVDVVLTGSPYAASLNDVITNNFDPKVDPLFNEIAKENKNVALVGTQGEILQNKALLVDALHTNAEGTAIYNQSVIDALSQFKNEVPSSNAQDIAQVQKTNTVAVTPPVITQAASNPVVAQSLATSVPATTSVASAAQQYLNANPDVKAEFERFNAQDPAKWTPEAYAEYHYSTYGANEGRQGAEGLAAINNNLANQILSQGTTSQWTGEGLGSAQANAADMAKILASTGITDISQFGQINQQVPIYEYDENGNATQTGTQTVTTYGNKLTGQAVPNTYSERQTGNAFGGTYAGSGNTGYRVEFDASGKPVFYTTGASSSDAANWMPIVQLALAATGAGGLLGNALLGAGAGEIATNALGNAIIGGTTSGLAGGDILKGALIGGAGGALGGYLQGGPIDASNMTSAQFNDALETQLIKEMQGIGLSNAQISQWLENASPADIASVTSTIPVKNVSDNLVVEAAKTPITADALTNILTQTPTVNVTAKAPQQIDQSVLNLVNSQIAANAANPTNLANVQVTANKPTTTTQDVVNAISSVVPTTTTTPTQTITAQKPATTQEIVNAITSTIPTISNTQAQTIAEQVVTSNKPVTTQDVINAISATIPTTVNASTPVAEQVITSNKPVTTQDIINAITATVPTVAPVTTQIPETTIISERPSSITDVVNAATIPLIQPNLELPKIPTTTTDLSTTDKLRVAQLGLTAAGLLGAGSALSGGGGATQYPVVPVPESWTTPVKGVAPATQLPAINFGDRNLLIGTQWEKFLNPNYGKVPEPVQYSQPSSLSYNDLMGILGSKQGYPSKSNLTINDVISGIQNQYGQTPASTMG